MQLLKGVMLNPQLCEVAVKYKQSMGALMTTFEDVGKDLPDQNDHRYEHEVDMSQN